MQQVQSTVAMADGAMVPAWDGAASALARCDAIGRDLAAIAHHLTVRSAVAAACKAIGDAERAGPVSETARLRIAAAAGAQAALEVHGGAKAITDELQ
jgi:hypothetical protein